MEKRIEILNPDRVKLVAKLSEEDFLKPKTSKELQEFYAQNGLKIEREISVKGALQTYLITRHGWSFEGILDGKWAPWAGLVREADVRIHEVVDEFSEKLDQKDLINIPDEVLEKNYELAMGGDSGEKWEAWNPFGEHLVLKENGDFWVDEKVFEKQVKGVFAPYSGTIYLILDGNKVKTYNEYQRYSSGYRRSGEYKKVVFSEMFLAMLKENGELEVLTKDAFLTDTIVVQNYKEVSNIELEKAEENDDSVYGGAFSTELVIEAEKGKTVKLFGAPIVDSPFARDEEV